MVDMEEEAITIITTTETMAIITIITTITTITMITGEDQIVTRHIVEGTQLMEELCPAQLRYHHQKIARENVIGNEEAQQEDVGVIRFHFESMY